MFLRFICRFQFSIPVFDRLIFRSVVFQGFIFFEIIKLLPIVIFLNLSNRTGWRLPIAIRVDSEFSRAAGPRGFAYPGQEIGVPLGNGVDVVSGPVKAAGGLPGGGEGIEQMAFA
ncbi:hypothetical protein [Burkholderia sola]|uniref:hypothetical protein n=1 Tax=Burkholderia sola TaxID=2843302 RepID=UPI00338DEF3A